MNRDLARRVARLEADRGGDRIRYVVSDKLLTEEEWQAGLGVADEGSDEPDELSPLLSEAEWLASVSVALQ